MSAFDENYNDKDVELLKHSIDHLRDAQQKLAATAQAAKARRQLQHSAHPDQLPTPQQAPHIEAAQPDTATPNAAQPPEALPSNALSPTKLTPPPPQKQDSPGQELHTGDALPNEEFHGIHSK